MLRPNDFWRIVRSVEIGRKFAIKPNPAQEKILRQWIGSQRYLFNAKVEGLRYQLALRRLAKAQFPDEAIPFIEFGQEYARFKDGVDFLHQVPPQILRNGGYRFTQAVMRWQKKINERPTKKTRQGRQSVLITSELFSVQGTTLILGSRKFPVGSIPITAHLKFQPPKMISVSVDGNKWFVSFCNDDGTECPSYEELLDLFYSKDKAELDADSVGIDRGVKINAACSDGTNFVFSAAEQKNLLAAQARKKRYQRQMSRRFRPGQKQSANYYKARASKQKAERKIANIRRDFNHKASRKIADGSAHVIVFESLKIKNMTAAPSPKQDESGHYLPNGAAAKAGLNKAILNSAIGQLADFTDYKARQNHKLVLRVPAHHTSQTCRKCLAVDGRSRVSQALFICTSCGHEENADSNASGVVRHRGVDLLLSGHFHEQIKKKPRRTVNLRRAAVCHVTDEADPRGLGATVWQETSPLAQPG